MITLEQVKTQLGIIDTTHDSEITAMIPITEAKVTLITRRQWADLVEISTEAEAMIAKISPHGRLSSSANIGNQLHKDIRLEFIEPGAQISGVGIAADTSITSIHDNKIQMSSAATATGDTTATIGINIAYLPVIAKLVWWMIQDQRQDFNDAGIVSRSMGPVSVSYSNGKIDGRFGVPRWAVMGLPRYARGY